MTVVFRPLDTNMTITPVTRGQIFAVKILDAAEGTAVVSVNGETMKVRSDIPLSRHQVIIVMEEKSGESTIWRILKELSAADAPGKTRVSLESWGASVKPEIDIIHALRWLGVPLTENNIIKAGNILRLLGDGTPGNVLAAVISTKLGIDSAGLIQAIALFTSSLFFSLDMHNKLNSKDQIAFRLRQCCEGLQRLFQFIREHPECSLTEALNKCFPGFEELGRQLIGGQFFAQAQEIFTGSVFYYLPLFLYLPVECEAYLFPSPQGEKTQLQLLLLVETERLGRLEIDMKWDAGVLELQTIVEKLETKELFDSYWPELAARLEKGRFQVQWAGCKVESRVKHLLMKRTPRSFDLFI